MQYILSLDLYLMWQNLMCKKLGLIFVKKNYKKRLKLTISPCSLYRICVKISI